MSLASSLKKLLPGNKPERGHTLRKRGYHYSELIGDASGPSASCSQQPSGDKLVRWDTAIEPALSGPFISRDASSGFRTQQLYLERREKRRLRRSLKESGDFLGVQGINPTTGELDVLTPSSSSAGGDFSSLARAVQDKKESYESARQQLEAEKMQRWERNKQAIRAEHRNSVRWKKNTSGWSSAIEPNLSPIAQSSAATSPRGEMSTDTVVRTPSVRRSSEEYFVQSHDTDAMSGLRRKPAPSEDRLSVLYKPTSQPSPASHRTLSLQRSYSDLIPVDSEFPPEPSPKPPKTSSSVPAKRESHKSLRRDDMIVQNAGALYRKAKDIADGRVCLHTHHHHYWILSDSIALQAIPKKLRSSRERMPLRKADGNTRRVGDLAGFPDEGDMEDFAESRRPPSRNTNQRYFIDG